MQKNSSSSLYGLALFVGLATAAAFADPSYPTAPKPKPRPTASTSASPSPSPSASETPSTPKRSGPLKIITTDGTNRESPIRVQNLNFYDEGYGSKYNSEIRLSGGVQNTSKTATLKKVTVSLQLVDTQAKPNVIQEWKENPPGGELKPGQSFDIKPAVARNSLGTMLKARMLVTHEEVVEKDAKDPKKPGTP